MQFACKSPDQLQWAMIDGVADTYTYWYLFWRRVKKRIVRMVKNAKGPAAVCDRERFNVFISNTVKSDFRPPLSLFFYFFYYLYFRRNPLHMHRQDCQCGCRTTNPQSKTRQVIKFLTAIPSNVLRFGPLIPPSHWALVRFYVVQDRVERI